MKRKSEEVKVGRNWRDYMYLPSSDSVCIHVLYLPRFQGLLVRTWEVVHVTYQLPRCKKTTLESKDYIRKQHEDQR
jgi:hypothetical protein